MTQVRRKLNVYFFGVVAPSLSDQLTYYGATAGCAIITMFAVLAVC